MEKEITHKGFNEINKILNNLNFHIDKIIENGVALENRIDKLEVKIMNRKKIFPRDD